MSTTIINQAIPSRSRVRFYTHVNGVLTIYGTGINKEIAEKLKHYFICNGFSVRKIYYVSE
jgi:hypothetical protein